MIFGNRFVAPFQSSSTVKFLDDSSETHSNDTEWLETVLWLIVVAVAIRSWNDSCFCFWPLVLSRIAYASLLSVLSQLIYLSLRPYTFVELFTPKTTMCFVDCFYSCSNTIFYLDFLFFLCCWTCSQRGSRYMSPGWWEDRTCQISQSSVFDSFIARY